MARRVTVFAVTLILGMALILVNAGINPALAAEKKPVEIVVALHTMPGGLDQDAASRFAALAEEWSKGELAVKVFPGAVLGAEKDMLELIKVGEIGLGIFGDFPAATLTPELTPMQVPFLYPSYEAIFKAYKGFIGKRINEEFIKKANMMLLGVQRRGARNLTAKKPIKSPEDLKGLKLRLPEIPVWVAAWKETGALPTPISWSEAYGALQMGVVDAQENPFETILTGKIYEVQKYIMLTEHLLSVYHWTFSKRVYDKLSPENQRIIIKAAEKALEWANTMAESREAEAGEKLKAKGMEIIPVDKAAFRKAVEPAIKELSKKWAPGVWDEVKVYFK